MSKQMTRDEMLDEYYKRCCEKDVAWATFCTHPNDETWALFVAAREAEELAVPVDDSPFYNGVGLQ